MDLKLKAKFETLRIEALVNELARVKESASFSISLLNEIVEDKNEIIENKEGRFISSQKVVRDLRADVAHYQSELETFKDRAQVQLDIDREKTRLAREDAKYWANEAAKFEINCNNCNLS